MTLLAHCTGPLDREPTSNSQQCWCSIAVRQQAHAVVPSSHAEPGTAEHSRHWQHSAGLLVQAMALNLASSSAHS